METSRVEDLPGLDTGIKAQSDNPTAYRQPKKRFVGRRHGAGDGTSRMGDGTAIEESSVIPCTHIVAEYHILL